jgi:Na+/alanine symporter
VRRFGDAWRVAFVRKATGQTGALTPFQAFMTALAASIGTGNIAGVATAIVSGGPGALFWIWVYGFVAMAIKFAEAVLGVTYREARDDSERNGASGAARASEASLSEGPEGTATKSSLARCTTCATVSSHRHLRGRSRWSRPSRL